MFVIQNATDVKGQGSVSRQVYEPLSITSSHCYDCHIVLITNNNQTSHIAMASLYKQGDASLHFAMTSIMSSLQTRTCICSLCYDFHNVLSINKDLYLSTLLWLPILLWLLSTNKDLYLSTLLWLPILSSLQTRTGICPLAVGRQRLAGLCRAAWQMSPDLYSSVSIWSLWSRPCQLTSQHLSAILATILASRHWSWSVCHYLDCFLSTSLLQGCVCLVIWTNMFCE